jgi:UDP-N-acetylmuramate--alanine ligase
LLDENSDYVVIEADEFDRSFHHLRPFATAITSADPDHLDIYGTEAAYLESFSHYTSLVQPGGALVIEESVKIDLKLQEGVTCYTYGRTSGDFHAENLKIGGGRIVFDLISPLGNVTDVELGVPVSINIDNGIAAMALAQLAGANAEEIRQAMKTFAGVGRRFDFKIKTDKVVLLSDYAHHPEEIRQSILSLREVFEGRKITTIFQPHLYSRTNDFYREFAEALSLADEVYLTEIYPARELPMPGVTSQLIYDAMSDGVKKQLVEKDNVLELVKQEEFDLLVILGAGDLDNQMGDIAAVLSARA